MHAAAVAHLAEYEDPNPGRSRVHVAEQAREDIR